MNGQISNRSFLPSETQSPHGPHDLPSAPVHPKGSQARVLLTSVFGPYARDDEYGSRAIKPMELYHNQVTRAQGVFSIRMSNRSWGLMMIQANLRAPCAILDFPTLDRFIHEIRSKAYDIVGLGAIMPNLVKVQKMCALIREHLPEATIVVGGYVANTPNINQRLDADYIVSGEGVRWMRGFLGEDVNQPIRHPPILSAVGGRAMGIELSKKKGQVASVVIPTVGCPQGCNFCATSAMFGGRGRFIHFLETGDIMFQVMCDLEKTHQAHSFLIMDENFLFYKKRALRLLDLMSEHGKAWSLYVFSSADVLRSYTMDQLVALGISWLWLGLEGKNSRYGKLQGTDTHRLVKELQSHGIRIIGSTIIGLDEHTPDNLDEAIAHAVSHDTEFHQFMLYSASPETPLFTQLSALGALRSPNEFPEADIHGQYQFNFKHTHIPKGQETEYLLRAFQQDFEVNGPSIVRLARTILRGWQRYKNHPDQRIRDRFHWEARDLPVSYAAALWAARKWLGHNPTVSKKTAEILKDIYNEFGLKARLAAALGGRYAYIRLLLEDRRLRKGWSFEPPTFYEMNEAAESLKAKG